MSSRLLSACDFCRPGQGWRGEGAMEHRLPACAEKSLCVACGIGDDNVVVSQSRSRSVQTQATIASRPWLATMVLEPQASAFRAPDFLTSRLLDFYLQMPEAGGNILRSFPQNRKKLLQQFTLGGACHLRADVDRRDSPGASSKNWHRH
jgi:hypothetical protein